MPLKSQHLCEAGKLRSPQREQKDQDQIKTIASSKGSRLPKVWRTKNTTLLVLITFESPHDFFLLFYHPLTDVSSSRVKSPCLLSSSSRCCSAAKASFGLSLNTTLFPFLFSKNPISTEETEVFISISLELAKSKSRGLRVLILEAKKHFDQNIHYTSYSWLFYTYLKYKDNKIGKQKRGNPTNQWRISEAKRKEKRTMWREGNQTCLSLARKHSAVRDSGRGCNFITKTSWRNQPKQAVTFILGEEYSNEIWHQVIL